MKSKSINPFKFLIISKLDDNIFLLFIYLRIAGAHSNTQTSFTNEACVFSESAKSEVVDDQGCSLFSESAISEAVGMTRDVRLISV